MRFACAIIFLVFAYTFLACYQADILAVAQHVLSEGKTDYFYTLAPLLVTFVCFLLQLGAYAVTRVKRRFHGLTYFPSFLLLALIADVPTHVDPWSFVGLVVACPAFLSVVLGWRDVGGQTVGTS